MDSNPILNIGKEHQLFLDDFVIEETTGVDFHVNKVEKYAGNPVIRPDTAWEDDVHVFGNVVHDPSAGFKMWYFARTKGEADRNLCYAESADGLTWVKPELGIAAFKGRATNIVLGSSTGHHLEESYTVLHTPNDAMGRNYKLLYLDQDNKTFTNIHATVHKKYGLLAEHYRKMGIPGIAERYERLVEKMTGRPMASLGTALSNDGIHWEIVNRFALPDIHDISHLMYDPHTRKYRVYGRGFRFPKNVHQAYANENWYYAFLGRAIHFAESADFEHWSEAVHILHADMDDRPADELYSMAVFAYENLYIGLVQMYHAHPNDMTLDIQLAVSRDGITFTRIRNRETFIELGEIGEWDRFNHAVASQPVMVGDELRFYYTGSLYRHGKIPSGAAYEGYDSGPKWTGIGLAVIPKDRFVYAGASFDGGTIVTKPLVFSGNRLHLNCISRFGRIEVSVVDKFDSSAELLISDDVCVNSLDFTAAWKEANLESFAGQTVRLRFKLYNAKLFSFWID